MQGSQEAGVHYQFEAPVGIEIITRQRQQAKPAMPVIWIDPLVTTHQTAALNKRNNKQDRTPISSRASLISS